MVWVDLRCGQSNPIAIVHGFPHIADQGGELRVFGCNITANFPLNWDVHMPLQGKIMAANLAQIMQSGFFVRSEASSLY
jgi:hypothetical protein